MKGEDRKQQENEPTDPADVSTFFPRPPVLLLQEEDWIHTQKGVTGPGYSGSYRTRQRRENHADMLTSLTPYTASFTD